ncbi:winged helix-turn-helix transcriptional regulator [Amycolatopsis sp. H20-H5]|uniref:winged helix-turn-helix transcriptional regulator n=1 Tax=Amycolatopsis sp. H20-H5 TaxID=3046309 RepID=UPI002DB64270|nr:winged helix-turn-helix transcriptional regulator [Amycolatopsis sp. H20-H5]MEC3978898.1 winged helix-turn-helix transcriptional regulator [Amycolatopsis sp. H20-H5]
MTTDNVSYQRRVNDAVAVLRSRWMVSVLTALALGEVQYTKLLSSINEEAANEGAVLSDRVFTDTLRRAQEHGLIDKNGESRGFGMSRYSLTPMGRELLRAVRPLIKWAQQYQDQLQVNGTAPKHRS